MHTILVNTDILNIKKQLVGKFADAAVVLDEEYGRELLNVSFKSPLHGFAFFRSSDQDTTYVVEDRPTDSTGWEHWPEIAPPIYEAHGPCCLIILALMPKSQINAFAVVMFTIGM